MPTSPARKTLSLPVPQNQPALGSSTIATSCPSSTDLVRVEKSLASLGFFTPSNKKIKGVKTKTILFNRQLEGQKIEVKATILPSAAYGLPITSDQDKYLALQKIIADIHREKGSVSNPIGFATADLLRILGLTDAGKNYDDILEWGKRMTLTGISSEGVIYFAGHKTWATDTFHVFERFVSVGNQMPDGTLADQNYVWLSEWQLENINHNHLLPLDLETYRQLKNHIAKALVPLLQVWLYATLQAGFFEKRYRDLCQILNITEYKHTSKIKEKLGPSLDELQRHRYLAGWRIHHTSEGSEFKVVFLHGEKFRQKPHPAEVEQQNNVGNPMLPEAKVDRELLFQLMKRGITEKASIALLENLQPDQNVMDQLEWGDHLVLYSPNRQKFYNPAGLYIHLIKENAIPPETFETSHKLNLREAARQARDHEEQEQAALQLAYMDYQEQALNRYIETCYSPEEFATLVEAKKKEMLQQSYWKRIASRQDEIYRAAQRQIRISLVSQVGFMTFEAFREKRLKVQSEQALLEASHAGSDERSPNLASADAGRNQCI